MSAQTPRRSLARPRPNLGNHTLLTASSPNLGASFAQAAPSTPSGLTAREVLARKASLNALTSNSRTPSSAIAPTHLGTVQDEDSIQEIMAPATPAARTADGSDIEVGDTVDVPGGMHGTVKFVGGVNGKKGTFAGVELAREFAARGKNDGDVDGVRYFTTSVPGSGIFLPLNRASKRASRSASAAYTPPTPSVPKFSQSLGPGRAPSPAAKFKSRPSLPRPESPLRRAQNNPTTPGRPSLTAPTPSRNGGGSLRFAPSPTPGKFGQSIKGRPSSATGDREKKLGYTPIPSIPSARAASRSGSRLGNHAEEFDTTPIGVAQTSDASLGHSVSRPYRTSAQSDDEVERLKLKLIERDKQLKEQATSLAEMEHSLSELQSLLPTNGVDSGKYRDRSANFDDVDASQLRALLREKNDKISLLTAEFDAHRADFRSTIDTLELASTETERVYEKRVEELLQEIKDLQDRSEDVDSVVTQLKQLEEIVQELEEGLEDARRGEAEARGEVEFLRGEVERGRAELKREREKAAAALRGAGASVDGVGSHQGNSKEVEQRDDEIRGLKAIIHSLSRDAVPDMGSQKQNGSSKGQPSDEITRERTAKEELERRVKELEGLVERRTFREEELEREIEHLRKGSSSGQRGSGGTFSDHTMSPVKPSSTRDSRGTVVGWGDQPIRGHHRHQSSLGTMAEGSIQTSDTDGNGLWCEMCETAGHDILTCTNMFKGLPSANQPMVDSQGSRTGRDAVAEGLRGLSAPTQAQDVVAPLSPMKRLSPAPELTPKPAQMPNPMDTGMVAGKQSGIIDPNKWCALCERDGHESVDCPFEDAF